MSRRFDKLYEDEPDLSEYRDALLSVEALFRAILAVSSIRAETRAAAEAHLAAVRNNRQIMDRVDDLGKKVQRYMDAAELNRWDTGKQRPI